jgi:RHS repeat-associated protein
MDNPIPQSVTKLLNYDPFGMITFGRSWEAGSEYRYAFNGMEGVDEIVGNDNALDFGARIYDARTGRFFSLDNYSHIFPNISPYLFASGNPIAAIDFQGDSTVYINEAGDILMTSFNKLPNAVVIIHNTENFKFNVARILKMSGGVQAIDNSVVDAFFRRYGENYLVDEFFKFDKEYKKYWGETATWLDKDENGAYYPKLDPEIMDFNEEGNNVNLDESEAPIKDGPRAHIHPTTPYSDGEPSTHDYESHTGNKEGYNVIMGNVSKGDQNRRMILYNYKGSAYSHDISIQQDIISKSKKKPINERVSFYSEID